MKGSGRLRPHHHVNVSQQAEEVDSKSTSCGFDSHHSHVTRAHNHPSVWCYAKHHCRCDQCKELYITYQAEWQARDKTALINRPHNHPSIHCYRAHGCRCDLCREKNTAHSRKYYKARTKTALPKRPKFLSDDEVERLRKLVGYRKDVT